MPKTISKRESLCILTNSLRKILNSFEGHEIHKLRAFGTIKAGSSTPIKKSYGLTIEQKNKITLILENTKDHPRIDNEEVIEIMNRNKIVDVPIEELVLKLEAPKIIERLEAEVKGNFPEDTQILFTLKREKVGNRPMDSSLSSEPRLVNRIRETNEKLKEKWIRNGIAEREKIEAYQLYSGLFFDHFIDLYTIRTFGNPFRGKGKKTSRKKKIKNTFEKLSMEHEVISSIKRLIDSGMKRGFCSRQEYKKTKGDVWKLVNMEV